MGHITVNGIPVTGQILSDATPQEQVDILAEHELARANSEGFKTVKDYLKAQIDEDKEKTFAGMTVKR